MAILSFSSFWFLGTKSIQSTIGQKSIFYGGSDKSLQCACLWMVLWWSGVCPKIATDLAVSPFSSNHLVRSIFQNLRKGSLRYLMKNPQDLIFDWMRILVALPFREYWWDEIGNLAWRGIWQCRHNCYRSIVTCPPLLFLLFFPWSSSITTHWLRSECKEVFFLWSAGIQNAEQYKSSIQKVGWASLGSTPATMLAIWKLRTLSIDWRQNKTVLWYLLRVHPV